MPQAFNDFVVVLVLVLQFLNLLVLFAEVDFKRLDAFPQTDDFRLEDFDDGMVGDGFHEGQPL